MTPLYLTAKIIYPGAVDQFAMLISAFNLPYSDSVNQYYNEFSIAPSGTTPVPAVTGGTFRSVSDAVNYMIANDATNSVINIINSINNIPGEPNDYAYAGLKDISGVVNDIIALQASTKRIENYSGTTNTSGDFTVTFPTAFPAAPNIQPSLPNQSNENYYFRVSSVSATGFTVRVFSRAQISLLGNNLLGFSTTPVVGVAVDVLAVQK